MAEFYVDFSAIVDGSGTGPSTPYNTIIGKTFTGADRVWIRRNGSLTLSAPLTFNDGAAIVGWPIVGDDLYSIRFPYSTWDSDSASYAIIKTTDGDNDVTISEFSSFYRIYFQNTDNTFTSGNPSWVTIPATNIFKNCKFDSYGRNTIAIEELGIGSNNSKFYGCQILVHHKATLSGLGAVNIGSACFPYFESCAITVDDILSDGVVWNEYGSPDAGAPTFINCSITSTTSYNTLLDLTFTSTTAKNPPVFIDCTVDATDATGALDTIVSNCYLYFYNMTLRGASVHFENLAGRMHFAECNLSGNFYIRGTGVVEFVNLTLGGSIDNSSTIDFYVNNGSAPTVSSNTNIYVKDHSVYNDFHKYNVIGEVVKSSVYRHTGFSLKMFKSASSLMPLTHDQTLYVRLRPGSSTITLYGAYKNYSSFDESDIWFDVTYLDSTDNHRAYARSKSFVADSSVWTGDTGLTAFRLEIPVTTSRFCFSAIKIYLQRYESGAYVYIDPQVMAL